MKVSELRGVLEGLMDLFISAGATAPAKDLKKIADALQGHDHEDLAAFIAQARELARQGTAKPKKSKTASIATKKVSVSDDTLREYVDRLRKTGTNRHDFEHAFDQLKADKRLKLADLTVIAQQYSGNVTKYKTIRSAHDDISKTFVQNARFENKLR